MKGLLVLLLIIPRPNAQTTNYAVTTAAVGATGAVFCNGCSRWCPCSNIGLTSVPQDLPTYTTELYLGNNVITTLSQSDFSSYSRLRELDLQYNQISVINSRAFYSLTRLDTLDLSGNRLTSLRSDVFEGLDSLEVLYLDHNNITNFPEASSLVQISTLRMDYNQMETLSSTAYDILVSISYVDIDNNPWQCDCRMLPFKQKMTGSHSFENQTTCAGPCILEGKSLRFEVNPEDLICEETPLSESFLLISGFLGVAVGILLTLAVFLVIWCRKRKTTTGTAPAPDTPQVTTRDGHDVTGTGAAESDDVERALDPDPYDLDLGYRLVRPSLPPIAGTSLS